MNTNTSTWVIIVQICPITKDCIGVGKTKQDAFVDMISTNQAFGAADVNCNYNSYSDQWIAIGYRRTSDPSYAITDMFLYLGDNPADTVYIGGAYKETQNKQVTEVVQPNGKKKKQTTTMVEYTEFASEKNLALSICW